MKRNKIRNAAKLKIRMAKWLGLHESEFNLEIADYIGIANKRNPPYPSIFDRCFGWQIQELYYFEIDKGIRDDG